ncbi:hypothetical protein OUZ56_016565 [Daphnia magna]|uniref:Uncharacterized protein n=1 Tax=Daphnia magna TaxID=35525 RepID=A0ABR0AQX6_9CRUS|nr:hypothetical protein OUZ56_016565 [Daphnia magna]
MATTYLEGDKYPSAACVIPSILSLQEHFTTTKEKELMLKRLYDLGLFEMKKKFEHFMDVTHPQFDQTYLMCCILHPSKTLELNGELFEEGKRRMYDFLKQEVIEGLCLLTISNSEEEEAQAPNPKNQPQSAKEHTQLFKRRRLVDTPCPAMRCNTSLIELKREIKDYLDILDKGGFDPEIDPFSFWKEKSGSFCEN